MRVLADTRPLNFNKLAGKDFWIKVRDDSSACQTVLDEYYIQILECSGNDYTYHIAPAVAVDGKYDVTLDKVDIERTYKASLNISLITPLEGYTTEEIIEVLQNSKATVKRKIGY
jgi:hypothetical protein